MNREGGFGEPLIYAVVGGSVGAIVAFLFSLLFHSFGMFTDQRNPFGAMAGMGIGSIGFIILVPLAIVIMTTTFAPPTSTCLPTPRRRFSRSRRW